MREIKFRAWDKRYKCFVGLTAIRWRYNYETNPNTLEFAGYSLGSPYSQSEDIEIMQYTGLKDKNGLKEVYEGDIIDEYGNIKGNIYEMDKGETDFIIQGFGDKDWGSTFKKALERGLKYSE